MGLFPLKHLGLMFREQRGDGWEPNRCPLCRHHTAHSRLAGWAVLRATRKLLAGGIDLGCLRPGPRADKAFGLCVQGLYSTPISHGILQTSEKIMPCFIGHVRRQFHARQPNKACLMCSFLKYKPDTWPNFQRASNEFLPVPAADIVTAHLRKSCLVFYVPGLDIKAGFYPGAFMSHV